MVKLSLFGGLDGIGMNMMSFQHANEMIIIDAGIMFPDADLHGIDKIIPSFSYFEEHQKDIKGIFLTHGHEDHIGAIAHFIEKINVPIYGTKLTLGMVEHKLMEADIKKYKLVEVNEKSVVKFNHFRLEFVRVSHSIPDGVMTIIHSPAGLIVHSGDFKIDYTPVDGKVVDLKRIANIGNKGVLLFMSDSTNAVKKGHTQSEKHVGDAFEKEFAGVDGRLLVATFSSNIHRLQQAINVGKKFGRKICFVGKSMENTSAIARRLGYLDFDDEDIISMNDVDNYADEQILVLVTGSQGEPLAALTRMANDKHPFFSLKENDTVIMSALPIPGNEKMVYSNINKLGRKGVKVIYEAGSKMHVSGHAYAEELKLMLELVKPKFFIPIHGEYRHLLAHKELAEELGIVEKVYIPENGDQLEIDKKKISLVGRVENSLIYIDSNSNCFEDQGIIDDRQLMAANGVVSIVVFMDRDKRIIQNVALKMKGISNPPDDFMIGIKDSIVDQFNYRSGAGNIALENIEKEISDSVRKYMLKKIGKRPLVIPIIL